MNQRLHDIKRAVFLTRESAFFMLINKFFLRLFFFLSFLSVSFLFLPNCALANNLTISNVTLEDRNATANTMVVQFDISWDHSWRKDDGRHDAAWVFVKLYQNSTAPWVHGKLYTAGTNPVGGSSGSNPDLKIVVPSDKIGAFISRTATGRGTFSSKKVRLVVDYGSSGLAVPHRGEAESFSAEVRKLLPKRQPSRLMRECRSQETSAEAILRVYDKVVSSVFARRHSVVHGDVAILKEQALGVRWWTVDAGH
ncbi:MAG: hypothetical protein H6753_02085 [Candidatus Omnitrophica bacterium]|nr:hypothetical protein [Candidatus Omnitrophota bacterium]